MPAALFAGKMRRGIDTAGKARCDDEALEAEIGGKTSREFLSDRRAVACTDDGNDGNRGEVEIALHVKKRRGSVDFTKRRRVARLADGDQLRTESLRSGKLLLRLVLAIKSDVVRAPATAGEHRHGIDGGFGAAELVDERAERGRTDILAADQAEPGKPLAPVEPDRCSLARRFRGCSRQSAPPRLSPAAGYSRRGGCRAAR